MLFFVVRTDVKADDGMQRVFGAYDTREQADAFMTQLREHMRGTFAVYEGHPAE